MKINLGSRFLFTGIILLSVAIYTFEFENPRGILRTFSYILGLLGIWGTFFQTSLKVQLTGHIRRGDREIPFEGLHATVRNLDLFILGFLGLLFAGVYFYHYYLTTKGFQHRFFLGERDFTSMGEVVLNFGRGLGFYSPFHGDGQSSFLRHHFAPGILIFLPWLELFGERIALAWGHFAYSCLTLAIYLLSFREEWRRSSSNPDSYNINPVKWFILWGFFLALNLYFYRILFSYHFEILFILYFTLLLANRLYTKGGYGSKVLEMVFLALILTVKEDTAVYISIYYLGEVIYKLISKIKNWKWDLAMLGISCGYFLIGIPYLRDITGNPAEENWYHLWAHWIKEDRPVGILDLSIGILSQPFLVITTLYHKLGTLWEISLGFGFLFYLAPRYFLYLFTILCIHFLSGREWHNTLYNYYIYTILPVLIFASLEGLRKLADLSHNKSKMALGYLVLSLVLYRNSLDASFPYSSRNLPNPNEQISSNEVRERMSIDADMLRITLRDAESVATQFDLGLWVPTTSKLYPLSPDPRREDGSYPEYILTNTESGFSPYTSLETIKKWEKEWNYKHGYRILNRFGDLTVWKR